MYTKANYNYKYKRRDKHITPVQLIHLNVLNNVIYIKTLSKCTRDHLSDRRLGNENKANSP